MISKEEALDLVLELEPATLEMVSVINKIYESIGKCETCVDYIDNELGTYCYHTLEEVDTKAWCSRHEYNPKYPILNIESSNRIEKIE